MANRVTSEYFRAKGLLPFQVKFAQQFIENEKEPFQELVSPVGTGKTRIAATIIAYELKKDINKHILILSPTNLLSQWNSTLKTILKTEDCEVNPLIVDRNTFLRLESNVNLGESPWPIPGLILMGIDLAKRDDILSSLMGVSWDLVVFDESNLLKGKRKAVFDLLKKSGNIHRALLLTSNPSYLFAIPSFRVKASDIIDWSGQQLFPSFEKKLKIIYYQRTAEETEFLKALQEFTQKLLGFRPYGKLQKTLIDQSASSSVYAIERTLRRFLDIWYSLRNQIVHGDTSLNVDIAQSIHKNIMEINDTLGITDEILEDTYQDQIGKVIHQERFLDLFNSLESLLGKAVEVRKDSKLDALHKYLREFCKTREKSHCCIWTSFKSTAYYLRSSLDNIDGPIYMITGDLENTERSTVFQNFRENGGIMIMTNLALFGINLEFVDKCINYDLPLNPNTFGQRWGRLLRYGRNRDLEMIILKDKYNVFQWEEEIEKAYKKSLALSI